MARLRRPHRPDVLTERLDVISGNRSRLMIRNPIRQVLSIALAVATIAVTLFITNDPQIESAVFSVVTLAIGTALSVLLFWLATRSVIVTRDCLIVRNPLRTVRLRWSEIAGFVVNHDGRTPTVVLRDRTTVALWAARGVYAGLRPYDSFAERCVSELCSVARERESWGPHKRDSHEPPRD